MEQREDSVFSDSRFEYNIPDDWKRKSKELNENAETVREEISAFREKVNGIPGLTSRLDDCYLLSFLRAFFFDQEAALRELQKFCMYRNEYPEYFEPLLVSENRDFYHAGRYKILSQKDSLGRTVCILKLGKYDFSKYNADQMWRSMFTACDFLLFDQTIQIGGICVVLDCADFNLSHLKQVTFKFVKVLCQVLLSTYPLHVRAIHVVNTPFYFSTALRIITPFVSKEKLEKLFIHGSELGALKKHIEPADILPEEYGGSDPGFSNDWLLDRMVEMEEAIKENSKCYGYHLRKETGLK